MVVGFPYWFKWWSIWVTPEPPLYTTLNATQSFELIEAFKAGDEAAFKTVFDGNYQRLFTFAFKLLKNREQAEEVVHDAFLNVWTQRDRLDSTLPVLPYLYTATKRLALNSLRSIAASQRAVENLWNTIEEISNRTEEEIFSNDLQRITEKTIAILPRQQQQVFKMSRYEGLSYEEIAQQLNISKNTVRNHLSAALKSLRTQINEADI